MYRAAHPSSPAELLTEVEWITSVVCRASDREVFGLVAGDTALAHAAPGLQRVRGLMLALLARFHTPPDPPTHTYYKVRRASVTDDILTRRRTNGE